MDGNQKVFGIGLNRTGTSTLRLASRSLGFRFGRKHGWLMGQYRAGNFAKIFEFAEDFGVFEDWPWPLMYQELLAHYGDRARYVLTVRESPEKWLNSIKQHSQRTKAVKSPREAVFGYAYPHGVEDKYMAFYTRHNQEVEAHFAAQGASGLLKKLCWETGDGWPELCGHLAKVVPDMPFPHANSRLDAPTTAQRTAINQPLISAQLKRLGLPDQKI